MNHKRVLNALASLGLSQTDAEVYIHLATRGPQEAESIAEGLRMQEDLLRKALENLKNKGLVTFTSKQSTLFFALSFNKALDLLIEKHIKETQELERSKDETLSKWAAIRKGEAN